MNRIALVTGGGGFIGSHLVDRLLADDWKVKVIDNLSSGHLYNLQGHTSNPRLRFYKADVRSSKVLVRLMKDCDTVFHLAAHADIRASLRNHSADLENNVVGTLALLEAMAKTETTDLVFASTSAIYGDAQVRPTTEEYNPTQTSLYGASKLACEAYAEAFTQFSPIRFWAFRFANVVGERCRRGVIWDFVHKLRRNRRVLEILGDGRQSKEYLHVKDCVEGMMCGYQGSSERVNIFNLGIDEQTTVDRVADIVIEEMGLSEVKRNYTGGRSGWIGDNPIVELSIAKLKRLGWKPSTPAEQAIRIATRWTISRPEGTHQRNRP